MGGEVIGKVNGRKGMVVWNRSYGVDRMWVVVLGCWSYGNGGPMRMVA